MRLGYVIWFDGSIGEGYIYDIALGHEIYIHYSAIENSKPHFKFEEKHNVPSLWRVIKAGDIVEFSVYKNLYSMQVESVRVLEPEFDSIAINNVLEMMLDRGFDLAKFEEKYNK